jgi:hypothetical protein
MEPPRHVIVYHEGWRQTVGYLFFMAIFIYLLRHCSPESRGNVADYCTVFGESYRGPSEVQGM